MTVETLAPVPADCNFTVSHSSKPCNKSNQPINSNPRRAMTSIMTRPEKKAVAALAGIFALRMFGLFLLLPVLAIYAARLPASTPLLVGLTLGIYGLTQGLFQIPFGMASDHFGRKRVITAGLLVFVIGSVVAALSDSIGGLIAGRAIQGAGAVSAAVLALTADLTGEQQRTKAMAVIGISIGFVFLLSLMLAPPLQSVIGVAGIFWLSVALALVALLVLWRVVPDPAALPRPREVAPPARHFGGILADGQLMRLNAGVFFLHLSLTAMFVALPALLQSKSGIPLAGHWKLYVPVLLLSVLGMIPLLMLGSGERNIAVAFRGAVGLLLAATTAMAWAAGHGIWALLIALWLFFVAFNALEAMLPSLVSRIAPPTGKGAAIGVYSTFQFLGMFAGGLLAGWLSGRFGADSVYWLCAAAAGLWLAGALTAPKFRLAGGEVFTSARHSDSH